MSPVEASAKARQQNTIAESVRTAIKRTCVTLDLGDTAQTADTVCQALRNVLQHYELRRDMDCDPSLGEPETFDDRTAWEKAGDKCSPALAAALEGLIGGRR